jgi:ABC-type amino acid transport substrate-binding protein
VFGTTVVAFFLAEMGDKTQIATVALAARYDDLVPVVAGSTLGLMLANVPAVFLGDKVATLRAGADARGALTLVSAVIFAVLGFVGISFVAFTRDPSVRLNAGWADLAQHRVAFVHGWKMFEANAIGAKVVQRVDKAEQLFLMLDAGRTDLALYTLADGQAMVRSMGLDRIQAVSPSLKDVDMYLYLNRRHEALVPKLVRALRDMKADGTHARIVTAVRASK